MKKAFLFVKTDAVVVPDSKSLVSFIRAVERARDRVVIIRTPDMTGAGVVVRGRVFTSLFLVANFSCVSVRFPEGEQEPAFVTRKDQARNLAELVPTSWALSRGNYQPLASSPNLKVGEVGEIGSPLLIVDVGSGVPRVNVAGTRYVTHLAERFEERFRIKSNAPRGLIGGAVWDMHGRFVGLTIGEKIPSVHDPIDPEYPSVYALPGREVMEFAESN